MVEILLDTRQLAIIEAQEVAKPSGPLVLETAVKVAGVACQEAHPLACSDAACPHAARDRPEFTSQGQRLYRPLFDLWPRDEVSKPMSNGAGLHDHVCP